MCGSKIKDFSVKTLPENPQDLKNQIASLFLISQLTPVKSISTMQMSGIRAKIIDQSSSNGTSLILLMKFTVSQ